MGEEYEVKGRIIQKRKDYVGCSESVFRLEPITLYTIEQEDGSMHRGGFMGHYKYPELGDLIEMHLEKDKVITQLTTGGTRIRREDGFVETPYHETKWEAIKRYRILERKSPKEEEIINY